MDWLQDPIEPMLAELVSEIPQGSYSYEVKWDGVRASVIFTAFFSLFDSAGTSQLFCSMFHNPA